MTTPDDSAPEILRPDVLELDPPAGDLPAETPFPAVVAPVGLFARLTLTEPVRLWLYPLIVAGVALLVTYGLLSDVAAPQWVALAAAALGVGGRQVVEGVRASVVSPRTAIRMQVEAAHGLSDMSATR